ncbi:hypothetical protein Dthio_PD0687 [Desulfonatronospira thiodismutans ASO3-1]|uniref:Type IV pilus assembly PilZ n=2 Tax=Desulfonatronospira thiodismutans TaxID=488939 RepID=D6SRP3_9BACT|nr:hypothetical protein Dthio_PD0687 [Desulfonatronospira thiodismutans ASO3-1]
MAGQSKKRVHIKEELHHKLNLVALQENLRPSVLLESILNDYIQEKEFIDMKADDKRRFRRKSVVLPAMVYEGSDDPNVGRYFATTVYDISVGGICLAFPLEREGKIEFLKSRSEYEVICYLSGSEELSRFKCIPHYASRDDYTLKVGGSFVQAPADSHDKLSQYLTQ